VTRSGQALLGFRRKTFALPQSPFPLRGASTLAGSPRPSCLYCFPMLSLLRTGLLHTCAEKCRARSTPFFSFFFFATPPPPSALRVQFLCFYTVPRFTSFFFYAEPRVCPHYPPPSLVRMPWERTQTERRTADREQRVRGLIRREVTSRPLASIHSPELFARLRPDPAFAMRMPLLVMLQTKDRRVRFLIKSREEPTPQIAGEVEPLRTVTGATLRRVFSGTPSMTNRGPTLFPCESKIAAISSDDVAPGNTVSPSHDRALRLENLTRLSHSISEGLHRTPKLTIQHPLGRCLDAIETYRGLETLTARARKSVPASLMPGMVRS